MTRRRILEPFARLTDALAGSRGHATAALLILGYVFAWWIYAVIAKGSQDIHFDMGEVASWSVVPAYGYPKHPPFPAWVAMVWFALFPYADWAYYLLSTASIGVALWFVWLIAARYVEGPKRVLALTFLTFSPGFNFQPLKFNSNALLIPAWAAASYLFIRSFSERSLAWGAAAGVGAAIAMLTKYWSVFLILGFVVAALAHPGRWDYLRSPAPWASLVVGGLLMAPNIVSLVGYDFQPFRYATASHEVMSYVALLTSFGDYFGGVLFLTGGFVVVALVCRPDAAALYDMVLPREPDRQLMAIATWTALFAPVLLALILHTRLATLWTMPMWAMLPATLLSARGLDVTRNAAAGALAAAVAVPVVAILLSPAIAYVIHRDGLPNYAAHYRLIAQAVDEAWRQTGDQPLRFFGSGTNIGHGARFYLRDQPRMLDIVDPRVTPWADDENIARAGIALVCPVEQKPCMDALDAHAKGSAGRRQEVELSRRYLGSTDAPVQYLIVTIPPTKP